ncbi:hypothetical protein BKI52_14615 [marine bacterium AO1-C]|nr:hypothetical protein BKI52_14615 [marine bacterium AO1-C]
MKIKIFLLLYSLIIGQVIMAQPPQYVAKPTLLSNPLYLGYGLGLEGSDNLMMLPENRLNPTSRKIGVHFMRLKAQQPSNLPPIFYLRGGPGEAAYPEEFYRYFTRSNHSKALAFEIKQLNKKRDVILMSQRGASRSPGLPMFQFKYRYLVGSQDKPLDPVKVGQRQAKALKKRLAHYKKQGLDPAGYDIINLTEDIEDVRKYYGYGKIALVGNSFGSQTALAYHKRYPKQVDRMLLSAVEPLDHAYDDPQGVWEVLARVAKEAENNPKIKAQLPKVGLLNALKEIVKRLEKAPVKVTLNIPGKKSQTVIIGVHDFQHTLFHRFSRGRRKRLESWPKYITELYNGDYRVLAYAALRGRVGHDSEEIMPIQMDNSLGISAKREKTLNNRPAVRWLGDINAEYKSTREVTTSPIVNDDFRTHTITEVPVLMIHGEMDRNTPLSNAHFLMKYLKNGHLLQTTRGTHGNKWQLFLRDEKLGAKILEFMAIDFAKTPFQEYKKTLPARYEFPALDFLPIEGKTLYESIWDK